MSNQIPNSAYYSQRLQQQQQRQLQAQQAAVMSALNPNHPNLYANAGLAPHYYNMRPPPSSNPPLLPVENPNVKFKVLPFFEKKYELIKPTSLRPSNNMSKHSNQEMTFTFKLTNQQAADLAENREIIPNVKSEYYYQVQLRIVALNESSEQDDNYPPNLSIKMNQRPVQLPNPIPSRVQNKEPVRPSRPLNVTPLCKVSPYVFNVINVNWTYDYKTNDFFVMSVNIVKKLFSDDLLARLRSKGIKPVEYTTKIIQDKLGESDLEVATDSLQVNLLCPLSRRRMTIPCRASTCTHLQCFDAITFLQMNEKKQTWVCPVCNQSCLFANLFIDGYFLEVLESHKENSEIILHKDGSWSAYVEPKEEAVVSSTSADMGDLTIVCLDDDNDSTPTSVIKKNDTKPPLPKTEPASIPLPPSEPEIVTLD